MWRMCGFEVLWELFQNTNMTLSITHYNAILLLNVMQCTRNSTDILRIHSLNHNTIVALIFIDTCL